MPSIEVLRLASAEMSGRYGSEPLWPRSLDEKISASGLQFLDGLAHAYEARLQRIRPDTRKNHYYWHHRMFVGDFLGLPQITLRDTPELMLAGYKEYFDRVEPIIRARREDITMASGREPKKIAVFIGPGAIMDEDYRAIGVEGPPSYTYAIAGALDAFLTTQMIDGSPLRPRDPERPVVARVIGHEPAHALWNSVLVDENGIPTWQLTTNRMVYEALAGPLDPKAWEDVNIKKITSVDFTPLEETVAQIANGQTVKDNFGSWLDATARRNRIIGYHPLGDPTWALFYQWASQQGDEKFWYKLGKKLPLSSSPK